MTNYQNIERINMRNMLFITLISLSISTPASAMRKQSNRSCGCLSSCMTSWFDAYFAPRISNFLASLPNNEPLSAQEAREQLRDSERRRERDNSLRVKRNKLRLRKRSQSPRREKQYLD